MDSCFDDFTLLIDGKEAFPQILSCIQRAKKSIRINMFIWRDDQMGNTIAQAILDAANRGVRVWLSVDRVGVILELAEEYRSSFFHEKITLVEKIKIGTVRWLYPELSTKQKGVDSHHALRQAILTHPNITAEIHRYKADHSKYYIFDEEILILGGINIEDKENGADISGRVYQDYMVKMNGSAYVKGLETALTGGKFLSRGYGFCMNTKECDSPCFAIKDHYLDLIQSAQEELLIAMAYFAPPKAFLTAIQAACARGVRVTLLLPARSNLMHSASLYAAKQLMQKTDHGIALYLTPKMMHTKLMANEKQISFGSANVMKNAFRDLGELNLFVQRGETPFCQKILHSVAEHFAIAKKIESVDELHYSSWKAWLEGML